MVLANCNNLNNRLKGAREKHFSDFDDVKQHGTLNGQNPDCYIFQDKNFQCNVKNS